MKDVISRFAQAISLSSAIILAVLVVDSASLLWLPNGYAVTRGYVASATASPYAIERLAEVVQSRWPKARLHYSDGGEQIAANPHCPSDTIWLEIRVRGTFLAADSLAHGPLDVDASELGLDRCASGLRFGRQQNLVWGPVGGLIIASVLLVLALIVRIFRPSLTRPMFDWQPRVSAGRSIGIGVAGGLATYAACTAFAAEWRADDLVTRELVLATLVPAITAVPLVEEYVFRALMLERIARVIGPWLALLLSSASFAALHLPDSIMQALGFCLAGAGFGLIWLRTRSLLACFLGHALFNGLASLALLWQLPQPLR